MDREWEDVVYELLSARRGLPTHQEEITRGMVCAPPALEPRIGSDWRKDNQAAGPQNILKP